MVVGQAFCRWWCPLLYIYISPSLPQVIRNIAAPGSCLVALLYWMLVFPSVNQTDYIDVSVHASNALLMLLDIAVSRLPIYFKHVYQPIIYVGIYAIFNGLYIGLGGTNSVSSICIMMSCSLSLCVFPMHARPHHITLRHELIISFFFSSLYTSSQEGEKYIYSVLNYDPLPQSIILLFLVTFIATPLIYTGLFFWAKLFLWLSGEGMYVCIYVELRSAGV